MEWIIKEILFLSHLIAFIILDVGCSKKDFVCVFNALKPQTSDFLRENLITT